MMRNQLRLKNDLLDSRNMPPMHQGMQHGPSGLGRDHIRPIALTPPRVRGQHRFAAPRHVVTVEPRPIDRGAPHVQLRHTCE